MITLHANPRNNNQRHLKKVLTPGCLVHLSPGASKSRREYLVLHIDNDKGWVYMLGKVGVFHWVVFC